jgi:LCP family protein required for cell wall assembly
VTDDELPDDLSGEPADEPAEETAAPRGPRQAARRRRRRKRRLQVLGVLVLGGLIAFAVSSLPRERAGDRPAADPRPTQVATEAAPPEQDTLLLVRHGPDDGPALGITLLAAGEDEEDDLVLFLPEASLVDIPGFGLDRLGLAHQYGGAALVEASVENLLGVDIDHVAAVSNSGLAALLARTGGMDVEVDEQLISRQEDGSAAVRFEPGAQFLDGERLVEYWGFRQRGESELDTFPRQQQVLAALFDAVGDGEVLDALVSDGAPQLDTSADAELLASLLEQLAQAQESGELAYALLPVTPFGAGADPDDVTYRAVPDDVAKLAEGPLAASVPGGGALQAARIQVLNGVGLPGIGQEVDRRLEGTGFRIVLTDNARDFDFTETRILVYSEDEASLAAAEQVQSRLGVGTIQISRQPQSVVDLTIVVGADFVETATDAPSPPPEEQPS